MCRTHFSFPMWSLLRTVRSYQKLNFDSTWIWNPDALSMIMGTVKATPEAQVLTGNDDFSGNLLTIVLVGLPLFLNSFITTVFVSTALPSICLSNKRFTLWLPPVVATRWGVVAERFCCPQRTQLRLVRMRLNSNPEAKCNYRVPFHFTRQWAAMRGFITPH